MTASGIDAETIRKSVAAASEWLYAREGDSEALAGLCDGLRQHLEQLVPAVLDIAPRLRGARRTVAVHGLTRGQQVLDVLDEYKATSVTEWLYVRDLMSTSRSLLELYEQPGPLGEPVERNEIERAMRMRQCGRCGNPITEGQEWRRAILHSRSGPMVNGFVHRDCCDVLAAVRRAKLCPVPAPTVG
ncbi:hypothetical protein ABZ733_23555 [Streptomyces longwoodensis]|uniref:hypothetical protein n=1 Tax=Streptomyces longwoodensis TaxID=68231 RepID=UPI0033C0E97E